MLKIRPVISLFLFVIAPDGQGSLVRKILHFNCCGEITGRQCGMKLQKYRGYFKSSGVVLGDEKWMKTGRVRTRIFKKWLQIMVDKIGRTGKKL